ncbi:MAG TPA: hypothetical protein VMO17_04020 [Terriglobia bacterium]|nr:hypothetical protein [Terriglobia bacterium]
MQNSKRKLRFSLVDILVGMAVLMILSALVIPLFLPPEGRAATKSAPATAATQPARR